MTDIEYNLKNLVRAIKSSNEYNQYHRLLEKIKQDEELYNAMCEFRKKTFITQMESDTGNVERVAQIRNEFSHIVNNNIVSEFLIAEQRLNKLARQVSASVLDGFDLDVNFL